MKIQLNQERNRKKYKRIVPEISLYKRKLKRTENNSANRKQLITALTDLAVGAILCTVAHNPNTMIKVINNFE